MNYLIFDLEATCWPGNPPGLQQETIEIGAYLINRFGEVESSYNRFVKPILHPYLSPFCQQLTSIQQSDINQARSFSRVIQEFQEWGSVFDGEGEYLLCSWGNFDKELLLQDCELHKLDTYWLDAHINLKKQYQRIKRLPTPCGLKSAVTREGFEFTGIHHRGIDDAENLAKVFGKYIEEWEWQ